MTTSGLRTSIGLLLAAAMLLAGLVPPGYRHAHPGGQVAHRHAGHGHHHTRGHHHQGPDHRHSHDGALSTGAVAHVHLAFLFFDLSFPASDRSGADPDTDLPSDVLYVVRLTDEFLPTADTSRGTPIIDVSVSREAPAAVPSTPGKGASGACRNAVLLCDTARHERSGVQLF